MAESRDDARTSPKPPVVGRLDSLPRCRRELRKLYVEARHGLLATQDAGRLGHLVGLIARMLEADDLARLEARIITLEQTIRARP